MFGAIVHPDDVGMPQLGREVGFAGEALPVSRVAGHAGGQYFQRITARQAGMLREVDLPHPAGPE